MRQYAINYKMSGVELLNSMNSEVREIIIG